MSFLKNIFKKNRLLKEPVDLSVLKCDVHSHLIPNIDDGSKSVEDSLNMIKGFVDFGFKKIITTPHIMGDHYKNSRETILPGLEKVKAALTKENCLMEMNAAAEYYLDFDFEAKLQGEKLMTFGDNYLLVEVSYLNPPENIFDVMFRLLTDGYKPVLAHPERYNYWHSDFTIYEKLKDKGVLLQLNINSLTGYYSMSTKHISERLIEANMIDFIGSDCHHMGHIELMKKVVYEPALLKLIESGKLRNPLL